MMRQTITRTLTRSTISVFTVEMVDGKPEAIALDPVTVWGKPTDKEALKAAKEAYEGNVFVGEINSIEECYEISIDAFVAHAEKIEKAIAE